MFNQITAFARRTVGKLPPWGWGKQGPQVEQGPRAGREQRQRGQGLRIVTLEQFGTERGPDKRDHPRPTDELFMVGVEGAHRTLGDRFGQKRRQLKSEPLEGEGTEGSAHQTPLNPKRQCST